MNEELGGEDQKGGEGMKKSYWDLVLTVEKYGDEVCRDFEGFLDAEGVGEIERKVRTALDKLELEDEFRQVVGDVVANLVYEEMDQGDYEFTDEEVVELVYMVSEILKCRFWIRSGIEW